MEVGWVKVSNIAGNSGKRGNRLCCVFGTWQLLSLVASLRQSANDETTSVTYDDYLVLYETAGVSDQFKVSLADLASRVWNWKRIVWGYDLLTSQRRYGQLQILKVHRTIRATVGLDKGSVDEIWTCFINRPSEKLVLDAYPKAKIQLYEDGLTSYLPLEADPEMPHSAGVRAKIDRVIRAGLIRLSPAYRHRRSAHKIDRRHLSRVGSFYSLLDNLPAPLALSGIPRRQVPSSLMRDVIQYASLPNLQNNDRCTKSGKPRILMLGQALSRNGIMPYEQEAAIYRDVAGQLIEKGFEIVWKEHPRIRQPFFAELLKVALTQGSPDAVTEADLAYALPIELLAPNLGVVGCVAGTSAALLYLNWLYGMGVFTFAGALVPFMSGADLLMSEMVQALARPVSDLPSPNDGKFTNQASTLQSLQTGCFSVVSAIDTEN